VFHLVFSTSKSSSMLSSARWVFSRRAFSSLKFLEMFRRRPLGLFELVFFVMGGEGV